ncbi:MAG: hypothetical protein ACU83V_11540 [Gammaproteobacteria bacterium]
MKIGYPAGNKNINHSASESPPAEQNQIFKQKDNRAKPVRQGHGQQFQKFEGVGSAMEP